MPYVPPHKRPGYVSVAPLTAPKTRKAEFASNRDYMASNVASSPTKKHSPSKRAPTKSVLKSTRRTSPDKVPPLEPGKIATKFLTKIRDFLGIGKAKSRMRSRRSKGRSKKSRSRKSRIQKRYRTK